MKEFFKQKTERGKPVIYEEKNPSHGATFNIAYIYSIYYPFFVVAINIHLLLFYCRCPGMTNRKDMIDDALLRPGRLEVQVEIGLPKEQGRVDILNIHTNTMRYGYTTSGASVADQKCLSRIRIFYPGSASKNLSVF